MSLQRGELRLAPFPYSDLRGMKRRPVCVVSSDGYNAGPDVIVAMVTSSNARRARLGIGDVEIDGWAAAGLRLPSVVRTGRLLVIEQSLLDAHLGSLTTDELALVDMGLGAVLGLAGVGE